MKKLMSLLILSIFVLGTAATLCANARMDTQRNITGVYNPKRGSESPPILIVNPVYIEYMVRP